jgi:2',3'-cyclic-nucleotide 2'-phosphodiesterase/3'-nucleotidase
MRKTILFIISLQFLITPLFAFHIKNRKSTKAPQNGKITIVILETTDIHGNIYPYDYLKGESDERGLAKCATLIGNYRRDYPNVLLLDCGDLNQGSPLTFLYNFQITDKPNPMIKVLNILKYDAFTVGNHDIEQGPQVYNRCRKEAKFPWLCANAVVMKDSSLYFDPYVVKEVAGVRVGILGITTPGIPLWLPQELYPGTVFEDMVETAKRWVPVLQQKEKVDLLIGLFHSGVNTEYDKEVAERAGTPIVNASRLVAEQVPGFDLIFTGHAHQVIPSQRFPEYIYGGVPVVQAGSWGYYLGVAEIEMKEEKGHWVVAGIQVKNQSINDVVPDSGILAQIAPYHRSAQEYTNQEVGDLNTALSGQSAVFEDAPLMDLVNNAQLWASGADISFASCFNSRLNLEPGPLKVKDIYAIYRYENTLYKLSLSGAQIDSYLEYSARSYNDNITVHNVDLAQGIRYNIDISRPIGDRVEILSLSSGKSFHPDSTYTIALNSYRALGGGGYLSAIGAVNAPIIWKSTAEIRQIIIDYLNSSPTPSISTDKNWKIIPPEAERNLLNSERFFKLD